jgi:hypothetical protein
MSQRSQEIIKRIQKISKLAGDSKADLDRNQVEAERQKVMKTFKEFVEAVSLSVNGVEVPVGDVIKEWMRICDRSVTSRASELIEEKNETVRIAFDNITNQLEGLKEQFSFAS